jgi:hypothetical protein
LIANGEPLAHFRFQAPMSLHECRAIIPRAAIDRAEGHLDLELGIDAPASPLAVGLSKDSRELGFHVRTLRMVAV